MRISDQSVAPQPKRRSAPQGNRGAFLLACVLIVGIFAVGAGGLSFRARERIRNPSIPSISQAELDLARSAYRNRVNERADSGQATHADASDLATFRWNVPGMAIEPDPSREEIASRIMAKSAILVDASTGDVLFEKNADEAIPPASMTKLVAMYVAFRAMANGEISFDDVVELPEDSWAINIPAGSSLMFLAEGQRVTVRELLIGMAVASGNDAAIALAHHVSGSVDAFVARMNGEAERLGLARTRFVEPSGLSERNMTTAREFADFSLRYVAEYPEALKAFHSREKIEYPMPWNLGEGNEENPIVQYATNRLLGDLEGCDGLKTGFIIESGYNLSLTAERNGTRFISVTMGGPGSSSAEGSAIRNRDGSSLVEWGFKNFVTVRPDAIASEAVPTWGGTGDGCMAIPARPSVFTAPNEGLAGGKAIVSPEARVILPQWLEAPIEAGAEIGRVEYYANGTLVHTVALIADRNVPKAGIARQAIDALTRAFAPLAR